MSVRDEMAAKIGLLRAEGVSHDALADALMPIVERAVRNAGRLGLMYGADGPPYRCWGIDEIVRRVVGDE